MGRSRVVPLRQSSPKHFETAMKVFCFFALLASASAFSGPMGMPSRSKVSASKIQMAAPVTKADVEVCQENWANAIKTISAECLKGGDYVATAAELAGKLYGYGHSPILFKPTKAADYPFRPTVTDAMSYFVGGRS